MNRFSFRLFKCVGHFTTAMFKLSCVCFFGMITGFSVKAQSNLPQVPSGKIIRVDKFQSKYVPARTIDIWLPKGYNDSTQYAVLYMHDGQMLFDQSITWNHQAWEVNQHIDELTNTKAIENCIVVGIWNGGSNRHAEYFPQKVFYALSKKEQQYISDQLIAAGRIKEKFNPNADAYLKFLVHELKPFIDDSFNVYTQKEKTFIMGSSMGALISVYALCEYPQVFGGAACLSTHWPGIFSIEKNPFPNAMLTYLAKNLTIKTNHKIYFDCGDKTLDSLYPAIQNKVDKVLIRNGFNSTSWQTMYFPNQDHSEKSWNNRLNIPLLFLLTK